jgi:hypothetical protein
MVNTHISLKQNSLIPLPINLLLDISMTQNNKTIQL